MSPSKLWIFWIALLLCLPTGGQGSVAHGQCQEDDLEVFGVNPGDRLGRSVAVSGGRVFVGAIGDDGGGFLSGSVRSFKRGLSGYQLEHVFSGQSGAEYGSSLAAEGSWLAVGASGLGYIEMWKRDRFGWVYHSLISDPAGHDGDGFGSSLDLKDDLLIVGSPTFLTDIGEAGCVTVWRRSSMGDWQFEERLLAQDRVEGDNFGTAVSLDSVGGMLVGSPGRDSNGIDSGIAILYNGGQDGWFETARFGSFVAQPGDRFGTSVGLVEDHVFVGSPYSNFSGPNSGQVVSYRRSNSIWILQPLINPDPGSTGTGFGATLAIDGNLLAVGAPMDMGAEAMPSGRVNIYRYQQDWNLESSMFGHPGSFLGTAIAVDKGMVFSGAPLDSTLAVLGGGVKFVAIGDTDCDWNGQLDSCEIAEGTANDCDLDGIPDACAITQGLVADCDFDMIPDSCSTISGGVSDCDADGVPDECATTLGLVSDCNEDQIPDVCQDDCNQNGEPDACEVLVSQADCDQNGLLDECEIAAGQLSDCDGNGLPDICEDDCDEDGLPDICAVILGLVEDCNENLNPDSCDLSDPTLNANGNGYIDECEPRFIRGDADGVEGVRLADAVLLISRVFGEIVIVDCEEAADANGDGFLDISDGLYLLIYEFAGGPPPPAPFPECDIAPSLTSFPCTNHPSCP
ncbi:hypothetical protein CBD41_03895 [bacterium TMED181]|nr:hypothetical protein [Planctomycetota bacterium]OUW45519.1 MAG: hypothetical protein CBD41_03895 [bacterium TMED181]